MNPVSVLDYRYGTEQMRDIFRADSYLEFLMEVEVALAEVQETIGLIPKNSSKDIRNAISKVTRKRVEEIESEINHDIMAVVKALEEKSGESGKWIHFGATSYDIVDTARSLQHKKALVLIENAINQLIKSLASLDIFTVYPKVLMRSSKLIISISII